MGESDLHKHIREVIDKLREPQPIGRRYRPSVEVVLAATRNVFPRGARTPSSLVLRKSITQILDKGGYVFDAPETVKAMDNSLAEPSPPPRKKAKLASSLESGEFTEGENPFVCLAKPKMTLEDVCVFETLKEELNASLTAFCLFAFYSDRYKRPSARISQALLLEGPRGCGKSTIARGAVGGLPSTLADRVRYIEIPAWQFNCLAKPEETLKRVMELVSRSAPCIVLLDDLDQMFPQAGKSGGKGDSEAPTVTQKQQARHNLARFFKSEIQRLSNVPVLFLGTAEGSDKVDSTLFGAGSFSRSALQVPIPDCEERLRLLEGIRSEQDVCFSADVDLTLWAQRTAGCVVEELRQLLDDSLSRAHYRQRAGLLDTLNSCEEPRTPSTEADENASRIPLVDVDQLHGSEIVEVDESDGTRPNADDIVLFEIGNSDLEDAWKALEPRILKDGFTAVPNTSMAHVGGLEPQRKLLYDKIICRFRDAEILRKVGLGDPSGVLLWGPPGCGKTLMAKAIANACDARFIYLRGAEFLNKYVGESELQVRRTFERARKNAPCLVFFDEFDAICPNREEDGSNEVSKRVVNALLLEMDGVVNRSGVFVVAATNRPNLLDPAMLRSGRLEHLVYVAPPDEESRLSIIETLLKSRPAFSFPRQSAIETAGITNGFSGADLNKLIRNAAERAFREWQTMAPPFTEPSQTIEITMEHIHSDLKQITPTITPDQLATFEKMRLSFDHTRQQ